MKNEKLIEFKKKTVLKTILKKPEQIKKEQLESLSNPKELTLKNVELYEPISFKELCELNKKKYRDLKVKNLKYHMYETIWNLHKSIILYKELINRTEYWEKESTYNFDFKNWNTLKKTNGRLTRYYNDILKIYKEIGGTNEN